MKTKAISLFVVASAVLAACATPTAAPVPTAAPKAPAPAATAVPPAAPAATAVPPAAPAATKAPEATKAPAPAPATNVNNIGKKLPDDAASSDQQVITIAGVGQPGARAMNIMANVYNRSLGSDLFAIPLVRLNKDFQAIPGSATSWSPSADGKTWTFKLRPDLNWSDGTPVTANDFIASFRHTAKKETAYDFSWYFEEGAIKGYSDALAGKGKIEDIAIKQGASPKELIIETTKSVPYLPLLLTYMSPMQKAALEKHGPNYDNDTKTSVSSGPYLLETWSENKVTVIGNKNMPADLQPYLNRVIFVSPQNMLAAYQAGEVDKATAGSAADVKVIVGNPDLARDASQDPSDFRIHYFFFDMSKAPFNNMKVRQAFSKLFDRETIMKKILPPPAAEPAWSFLAAGFPGSNMANLKQYQGYNPEEAKKLYAESGVKITEKLTLRVRVGNAVQEAAVAMAQVYADELKKQLGVDVEVKREEQKVFMEAVNAKPTTMQFGFISYGMDFLDQSNMLSVFRSNGRHNWNNDKFMALLDAAGPEVDVAKRNQLYKDAEQLIVQEAPGIFAFQQFDVNLWRPFLAGETFKPGKLNTARGIGWPGFTSFDPGPVDTYVTKDVTKTRPTPPK